MLKDIVFDFHGVIWDKKTHTIDNDMIILLQDLYKSGAHLYLFSNTRKSKIDDFESEFNFLKYFERVILSEETGYTKPMHIAFKNLVKIIGKGANGILYIDDENRNLKIGSFYHLKVLKYTDESKLRQDLKSLKILN
jgi:FMN phosphatase YigB (HAD superfamily)